MQVESECIKIPKKLGEKTLVLARNLNVVNNELEIHRDRDSIYVPLARPLSAEELKMFGQQLTSFIVSRHVFSERKKKEASIIELLKNKIPKNLLASAPHAIDFVGDIAIVEIPSELCKYQNLIGKTILEANSNVRTVLAKAGIVSGTYRLREFAIIAGEPKTETIHKEYGCQYHVDVAKAYFSPRLSFEHNRVSNLVKENEVIVDLFAGVGPFAIQIAKTHKNVDVYAVDVNPRAIEFLKKNIRSNRVDEKVHPILGDARQVVKDRLSGVADRVIMNLPETAAEFVDVACAAMKKKGGIVHFYAFANVQNPMEAVGLQFKEAVANSGRKVVKTLFSRHVRETAPYEWQMVLDARIR